MNKPYVYITRTLPEEIVEPFRETFTVKMWGSKEQPVDREVLLEEAGKADALITMLSDQVDEELLSKGENVKVIANLAVGFDNIDIKAAEKKGVTITNTPDVLTETTADLTFGLLMATARRLMEANEYVQNGDWKNWAPLLMAGHDIHHKTIGIVGMGRIGEAVAHRAKGFHMNILYHNRSRKQDAEEKLGAVYASLDELVTQADFVVCLAPLTPETKGMFNKEIFKKMKSSAIFVNASRGDNANEEDLYEALVEGEIAAAGLDVFENEPISEDHPLLSLQQVVALPHIGSASVETRKAMMNLCLENVQLVLNEKEPKTKVTS
ncbi:2-hydroxyacid dehydrogenase [Pontibacillus yanchengensis]|uniref:Glyoxylate/hydroxypyruvate reductase B n=1 Tax=Pontibacillus yanchengensis Y32 TaxID=1385514 RepID=A0A0A2TAQ2_9BACI|nr:D-glycerate dehydrogenase [Pontibacillus yanchengensis]KGP71161.1 2-ketogluconate reductase [Pontibacillus yanchengensis Y32]